MHAFIPTLGDLGHLQEWVSAVLGALFLGWWIYRACEWLMDLTVARAFRDFRTDDTSERVRLELLAQVPNRRGLR